MADWVVLSAAPTGDQIVTAPTIDAAARKAGQAIARRYEGDGSAVFTVWVLGGPAVSYDATVTVNVQRTVVVAPTPAPTPPPPAPTPPPTP